MVRAVASASADRIVRHGWRVEAVVQAVAQVAQQLLPCARSTCTCSPAKAPVRASCGHAAALPSASCGAVTR